MEEESTSSSSSTSCGDDDGSVAAATAAVAAAAVAADIAAGVAADVDVASGAAISLALAAAAGFDPLLFCGLFFPCRGGRVRERPTRWRWRPDAASTKCLPTESSWTPPGTCTMLAKGEERGGAPPLIVAAIEAEVGLFLPGRVSSKEE